MADKQNLAKESQLALKQDILIAGQNITIAADGKTISAANPTSVTVTPVYQAGTLVAAIVVNGNTTNIYAPAQHGDNANQNLALSFSTAQSYAVGDFVIYQENLYKCITAIDTPAAWDSTKWMRALITDEMGQGSGGDYANQNIANTYDTTATYDVGDYVIYDGLLYKCITAVTTPGLWNATYWERCIVTDEMGSGGGLDLPDNWTWDEEALTAFGFVPKNSLGWGVGNTTYYTDTQMTWNIGGRSFTRDNAIPALIAYVVHDGWNGTICVSTDAEATHFSWNSQEYGPYEYMGYSWYLSGMEYSMTYNWHSDNINYLGSYSSSQTEKMVHDIVDASNLNSMTDQFVSIMEPGSGTLIAGGGEETDLSDATFKVETNGTVHGSDFVQGNKSWDEWKMDYQEITQAEYDELTPEEKEDITFFITDGVAPPGSDIEPNPEGAATDTLEKLGIDGTIYELSGGTEVIANPTGTPTDDLETVSIDGDIFTVGSGNASKVELTQAEYNALVVAGEVDPTVMYFIPDGPGSGDSGSYATLLWTNETPTSGMSANTTVTIPNLTAFDLIGIVATHNVTNGGVDANAMQIFSTSNTTADNVLVTANSGNASNYARTFTITDDTTLTFSDGMQPGVAYNSNYTVPLKIYGLRFGNGGSSISSEVVYSTTEHVVGKWIDGSDLYERTISATISSGTNTLLNVTDIVVVEIKGVVTNGSNKSFTVPYYDSGGDYVILNQNSGGINLLITSWFINNGATSAYITIRYTKTTT